MFEWLKPSSKDRKEPASRLKKEIKRLGLTQTKVAKDLEMSLSGFTYLLSGRSRITPTLAYAMEFKYGISSDWILSGIDISTLVLNTSETEDANLQLSVHEELELSRRVLTGLEIGRIRTIGDLVQLTEKDIMRLRLLGRKSLREIKQELARIGLTLAESESQPDEIYVSTLADSLEEKINVIEKATNIIDRHESQITQLVNRSRRTVHTVLELVTTVKNLEEEIKQIKEKFSLEWKKQYELGVELSNRYRELAGK